MNKYYNQLGIRQEIIDVLNTMTEIRHWRYDRPCLCVKKPTAVKKVVVKVKM